MREVLIKAIPFDDLKITELEGVQQVNEHGELVFSGLMRGEKESEYISWAGHGRPGPKIRRTSAWREPSNSKASPFRAKATV